MSFIINPYQFSGTANLLLDTYPAIAAYSLRKLKSAYSGDVARIRRTYDNTELNVGLSGNDFDVTSAKNFNVENRLQYSEDFSSWSLTAGSVSTNATTDPLGGSTADKLTHGSAININQVLTTTSNLKYYFSCYLKKSGSVNNCDLYIYRVGTGFVTQATFNINTGSVVSETYGTGATITDAGSGWWLCTINGTHAGTSTSVGVYNSTEVYAWGGQFQAVYAGPYIQTTTTAINRGSTFVKTLYDHYGNYDLSQTTTTNQPRIQDVNTPDVVGTRSALYMDGNNYRMSVSGLSQSQPNTILMVLKNTGSGSRNALDGNTSRQSIYQDGSGNISFYAGTTQPSSTAWGTTNNHFILANFDGASSTLYADGSLLLSVNPGSNGLTDLYFGSFGAGNYWQGYIQEVIIWGSNQVANQAAIFSDLSAYYV